MPDSAIGATGRQVRCASCRHSWFQEGAEILRPEPVLAPEPVAADDAGVQVTTPAPAVDAAPELTDTAPDGSRPAPPSARPAPAQEPTEEARSAPDAPAQAGPQHDPVEPATAPVEEFVHYPSASQELVGRPRRNPAKVWTAAAVAFFVVVSVAGGALAYFGAPNWAVNLGLSARDSGSGLNFYLPKPPERRNLPTGEEYFAFSARILNDSDNVLNVPPIVVELRDDQGRLVFSWMTKADKSSLKPNEEARVSESRLDIPKNARNLELRFVDSVN